MLTILTPSKTMDFVSRAPSYVVATAPEFHMEADRLRSHISTYDHTALRKLMSISDDLAQKVHVMYQEEIVKPAFWAYDGDVFKGVQAATLTESDALFAQGHVLVPSGLYGLVRPFDLISPYRLEMKAKLAIDETNNLYQFWADKLGRYVEQHANHEVLMLSSHEYARTITPYLHSDTSVVTPAFIDRKPDGTEAQVAIYNKMMRGVMGRWVIEQRVDSLSDIHLFCAHGYAYSEERSTAGRPVFYRKVMTPLRF
jgi:cytoplasmic iron level regulating protein YaaA (DUF328/UPF0246 family)